MAKLTQRYISKELVHFVGRGMLLDDQFALFIKIMNEGWIIHRGPSAYLHIKPDANISANEMYMAGITCFADIPLQDLSLHMEKYSSIGLSFSKDFIAKAGGVPVHYIAQGAGVMRVKRLNDDEYYEMTKAYGYEATLEIIPKGQYFNEMFKEFHELFKTFRSLAEKSDLSHGRSSLFRRVIKLERFLGYHIFSYLKFFDHLKDDNDPDNYYFEREWRIVGHLNFTQSDIRTVFFPSKYITTFKASFPDFSGQIFFTD